MLFNSFQYGIFISIIFILYWLVPSAYKWIMLLGASLYFYLCFKPMYLILLVGMIMISYVCGILIERFDDVRRKRIVISTSIILFVSTLFLFKYVGFTGDILSHFIPNIGIELSEFSKKLIMPIGISFYTFQVLGYIIDVYRGRISAEKHLGYYALFVSFFPQIASGPIGRADKLLCQYRNPIAFNKKIAYEGLILIIIGFYKKLVIADMLTVYVDKVFDNPYAYTGGALLTASVFFTIQVYCDFSGYSDIAIGSARLLGIEFIENFRSPYLSSTIKEFWSRWHISLSTWFRDYVYISMGGNRCSKLRRDINTLVTFVVSGIWHGANWTFIIWGMIHGLGQIVENHLPSFLRKKTEGHIRGAMQVAVWLLRVGIVCVFCSFAWIFFRANTLKEALYIIVNIPKGILKFGNYIREGLGSVGILGNIRLAYIGILMIVLMGCDILNYDGKISERIYKLPTVVRIIVMSAFIAFTIVFAQKGVAAEFVYIQF